MLQVVKLNGLCKSVCLRHSIGGDEFKSWPHFTSDTIYCGNRLSVVEVFHINSKRENTILGFSIMWYRYPDRVTI